MSPLSAWQATMAERLRLARLLKVAGVRATAGLLLAQASAAALPALTAVTTGWIVRGARQLDTQGALSATARPLAVLVTLLLAGQVAEAVQEIVGLAVARGVDGGVNQHVRAIALARPGIEHLEDPSFHDNAARASDVGGLRGRWRSPGTAVVGQVVLASRFVAALAAAAVLASFSSVLAVALLAASLTIRAMVRRQWMRLAEVADATAGIERRAEYWADLAAGQAAAKEVRLFGLTDWIMSARHRAALARLDPLQAERRAVLRGQAPVVLLAIGSAGLALLVPGIAAAAGRLPPDALATCLVAAWGVLAISFMGHEAFDIEYGMAAVRALDRLSALEDRAGAEAALGRRERDVVVGARRAGRAAGGAAQGTRDAAGTLTAMTPPGSGRPPAGPPRVRLEGVGFSYPGAPARVLDGLDLEIRPGEVLAVVGRNGAGKTTLVKLLAGLYRPTSGRIVIDGEDLVRLDLAAWRRRMTAVFQDFVRYPACAHDNIALSAPEHLEDRAGVEAALRLAGAAEPLAALPRGLDTPLWRGAAGGADVSGGQWQRIAIARALFAVTHGRQLLILDEPTAHLDVRAEAEFFDRVTAAARGASIVLISHRLSTVRRADRIVLLHEGAVAEEGNHADLLARDGGYAGLFRLQAARFAGRGAT